MKRRDEEAGFIPPPPSGTPRSAPTCDFLHRPEVVQLGRVHWWDFVEEVPEGGGTCRVISGLGADVSFGRLGWPSRSHPLKEVPMKCTSPLILVQFLKSSMLEAFTAMVLVKAPTPMPSQAGGGDGPVRLAV